MIEINGQEYNSEAEFEEVMLASYTMELNAQRRAYLLSTDWYVVRLTETGIPIPSEVSTKRQETREAILDATLITGETI